MIAGAGASLLALKAELARRALSCCRLCGHRCGADRASGVRGSCGVGVTPRVASAFLHGGEEPELVPSHTVFFAGCTMGCDYCQNWDIAFRPEAGSPTDAPALARLFEAGQASGGRNLNLVGGDPTPNLHTILEALALTAAATPVVWNSNMYMEEEAARLLDGVVDVYLADLRYGNDECARRLSGVGRYSEVVRRAVGEAHRQTDVMLRHLVLPGHVECCTRPVIEWVGANIPGVYFNLMFQYRPCHFAARHPELGRGLTSGERELALKLAQAGGLALAG